MCNKIIDSKRYIYSLLFNFRISRNIKNWFYKNLSVIMKLRIHWRLSKILKTGNRRRYGTTRVTSWKLKGTSWNPLKEQVKIQSGSWNPRVTSSNSGIKSSSPKVTSSNPWITSSNLRVTISNPRVKNHQINENWSKQPSNFY